ncbi:hypothetical protein GSI_12248 [Ganoderma sinense ZZ0214-1]|uniref:BTB domain-containing protein n=1 Tax=Ganoderma sinense ZZ0214-1 TaxID=1077348 RepID=A0A2G8RY99_9APHY|nr:hypothetical protein GSI_12248 [Ganoderma sinense ZZ0214-1]
MSSSDTSPRPSKRARHSLDQGSSPLHASSSPFSLTNLKHHPEFWFDDGNIVLVAQHTGFRIYRGLLAAQSTVFADMFASATSAANEVLEGCPVVHLTDPEDDLVYLLRILLPTSPTCYRTPDPEIIHSFDEIFGVVRLAHKYHIQPIEDQELRSLQEYWLTSDFDVFFGPSKSHIDMEPVHYIGAVNLARLTDTPLMLPLALYQCCYLGSELLDGWIREDDTVEYLSPEDVRRCFDARIALTCQESFLVSRLFDVIHPQRCKARGRCAPIVAALSYTSMREQPSPVVHALWEWSPTLVGLQGLCEGCVQVLHERDKEQRRRIWDALPRILGITVEGWGKPSEGAGNAA